MKREKADYLIQSVSHALDILESFTKTEDELGVTALSKKLGLHKNNVFRLLATLEHRGYIEQNKQTENYRLGPKTLQIGCTFIEQRECRRQARPVLESLMAKTGETAVLAVVRSNKVIYMDAVETDRTVRAVSSVGAVLPAHCTAVGKVQLAYMTHSEIERLYPDQELEGLTAGSIVHRDKLLAELDMIRKRGWALENEECDPDVRGVAVPIRDFLKNVVAAVGIIAPANRLTDERLAESDFIKILLDAGATISAKMGYSESGTK